ncbi:Ubiquitin carboxyl-terminal hydrolase [Quillaja saponaria]|uniref:Ubiquitin carboxyl-terminal hydrolase n=1 Tax=Quillaja saponaria TaxID=32244 RepID=A0AAD7L3C8_QUISA|nr:Ubiquitin carboxyl-terminal hydrolase [Quillaja saponaria]
MGFAEFLSLNIFKEASNGYLVDDCCVFGAEVSVVQGTGKGECLSMIEGQINSTYTWRIQDFAAVDNDTNVYSEKFTVGVKQWKRRMHPKGYSTEKSKSLSIFMHLDDLESFLQKRKLYAEYKFCIKDQLRHNHHEKKASHWFSATSYSWGYPSFISLVSLKDASKGYIMSGEEAASLLPRLGRRQKSKEEEVVPRLNNSTQGRQTKLLQSQNKVANLMAAGANCRRLALYPNGKNVKNESKQANGHLPLHLIIEEVHKLSLGWEVYASFKFFVHDQINDKYLTIQDAIEEERRLSAMKTEWGIPEFLSLNTFKDASNGYLVDDCCVFGAEVSVVQCTGKGECLSMIELEGPINSTYTWKI